MIVATTHVNSDIDAIASLLALDLLEGPAVLVLPGSMDLTARRLWDEHLADLPTLTPLKQVLRELHDRRGDRLLVADTADASRLGPLAEHLDRFDAIAAWDTHPPAPGDLPRAELAAAAACVSALVLTLAERGVRPSPTVAGVFLVGIHEDSGHFTYPETTAVDHRAAALCIGWGADPRWPGLYLPRGLTGEQLARLEAMSRTVQLVDTAIGAVALMTLELDRYEPQLSTLVGHLQDAERWTAAFLVAALEGRIYVIGRSAGTFDVAAVLRRIGGGGHPGAASATLQGVTIPGAVALLRQSIEEQCERTWTAGELAVRRFVSLPADRPIREAGDIIHQHRINALPLTLERDGRRELVGLVSRQEIDAALRHGMGERPVEEISAGPPMWVAAGAPVAEARTRLLDGTGRLIVVGDPPDRPIGILTRTTLLLAGSGDPPLAPRRRAPKPQVVLELAGRALGETWPLAERLGRLAEELGMSLHLVGGAVRDTLLGGRVRDIDLVVEGNAPDLGREAVGRFGGKLHVHEPFATARLLPVDGPPLDLATARSEYYESPASLPRVLHAELRRDLYRRDFTINAMAIALNPRDQGTLRDPYNGYDDLRNRLLRVLHGLSFHDDPTRAWRAARFAARFDFRLAPQSEGLLRAALRSGAFEQLGRERLGQEIDAILDEPEVEQAFRLLRDWNLLRQIHQQFAADREFFQAITRVSNARHEVQGILGASGGEPMPSAADVLWIVVAAAIPAADRLPLSRMVPGGRARRRRFRHGPQRIQAALGRLDSQPSRSAVARALSNLDLAERTCALGLARSERIREMIRWWEREGRGMRTVLDGAAVLGMGVDPGPIVGRILDLAQAAAWDGADPQRQWEIARRVAAGRRGRGGPDRSRDSGAG